MRRDLVVSVPDFSKIADDDLAAYITDCDGKWSPLIRSAMLDLGATGLDLNERWAEKPQDWRCPACNRHKREIVRLTEAGILLARLEVHHDHLGDYIKQELKSAFGSAWASEGPPGAARAEEVAERLLIQFDWISLCVDCNGADAAVKRARKEIPAQFSFAPEQISRFIRVAPNSPHEIDFAAADAEWSASAESFTARFQLAQTILAEISRGHLGGSPGFAPRRPTLLDGSWTTVMARYANASELVALGSATRGLLARSLSNDGVNSKTARRVVVPSAGPTDDEYKAYAGGGSPKQWAQADDAWRCPICSRTKRETLRPGKASQKWIGRLHNHRDFEVIREANGSAQRITSHSDFLICSGCVDVLAELRQKFPEFRNVEYVLPSSELRQVISSAPHARHEVDWTQLVALAQQNAVASELTDAYWKQRLDEL